MEDPKRLLPAILFCSFAFALWPAGAAAHRRGHPVHPRPATVVVRPAFDGGYYAFIGYRAIGGADLLHEQLRGVSGTIALRLGGR